VSQPTGANYRSSISRIGAISLLDTSGNEQGVAHGNALNYVCLEQACDNSCPPAQQRIRSLAVAEPPVDRLISKASFQIPGPTTDSSKMLEIKIFRNAAQAHRTCAYMPLAHIRYR
jgi:hypothetical protein